MQPENQHSSTKKPRTLLEKLEHMHPRLLLFYLALIGVSLVFLFLISGYLYAATSSDVTLSGFPISFYVSTIIIVLGSYTVSKLPEAFEKESMSAIASNLSLTTAIGVVFCLLQFFGWHELNSAGIHFTGTALETYFYVISGVHIAHLLGGMVFLIIVNVQVLIVKKDTVKTFLYSTNPYEKLKLRMLAIYWHFMDGLWLLLFFAFLIVF